MAWAPRCLGCNFCALGACVVRSMSQGRYCWDAGHSYRWLQERGVLQEGEREVDWDSKQVNDMGSRSALRLQGRSSTKGKREQQIRHVNMAGVGKYLFRLAHVLTTCDTSALRETEWTSKYLLHYMSPSLSMRYLSATQGLGSH